ncbi:hypothetical protein BDY19DRAFT_587540 [Irpex rosettiformis]|uniref:Uncharacterized protein n=1 Tax=Irpex rosettiformis TaxID=378272 RepID=A0ACB8UD62_9APHY|nr:hypothetical protein BDY19DRAFT_587540 [Irpex rosettiformis]
MRRRFRRRAEEAVRNGTIVSPNPQRQKLGEKPILHDIYLERLEEEKGSLADDVSNSWDETTPVAVMLTRPITKESATVARALPSSSSTSVNVIDWFRPTLIHQEISHSASTESKPPPSQPTSETPSSAQLAFLVAMPDLHRHHEGIPSHDDAASSSTTSNLKKMPQLPCIDLGIMEASVKKVFVDP